MGGQTPVHPSGSTHDMSLVGEELGCGSDAFMRGHMYALVYTGRLYD